MKSQKKAVAEHLALATSLLVSAIWSTSVHAEISLRLYRDAIRIPETKALLEQYVTGLGRGIFWAKMTLDPDNQTLLFCMPQNLSLDSALIQSLLDQEIRSPSSGVPYSDSEYIEHIMIRALETRFPCNQR